MPWIGGKTRLAKWILPLFPDHHCYVEPFCGAAALFFKKEASSIEVLNDVNGDIVNLYRVVQFHLDELCQQFRWTLPSRQAFQRMLEQPVDTLTDIQRAARFIYLQKLTFGGTVASRSFGTSTTAMPKLNVLRLPDDLRLAHERLALATIEHLDWQKCVAKYDREHSFFYCDPPYWKTTGYGVEFGADQYEAMAEVASGTSGTILISLNDCTAVREIFSGLYISSPMEISYTVGSRPSKAKEVLISNKPLFNARRKRA